ncbi:hypothetical protein L9F63_012454, partial [Diploptera punctata]
KFLYYVPRIGMQGMLTMRPSLAKNCGNIGLWFPEIIRHIWHVKGQTNATPFNTRSPTRINHFLTLCTKTMPGRVWARSEDNSLEWMSMRGDQLEDAIQVMRESFFPNESISKALRLNERRPRASAQTERIARISANDGVSIVAVEVATGRVVGVAFNKIQVPTPPGEKGFLDKLREEKDHDPSFVEVINYLTEVEGRVDVFSHYGVTCVLEHMFLATLTEFYGRGIGRRLVKATEDVSKALARGEDVIAPLNEDTNPWKGGPPPRVQAIMAIFTSAISQKIGNSLGWDKLAVVSHDELFFEGKPYSYRIGPDHPSSDLMGKKVAV